LRLGRFTPKEIVPLVSINGPHIGLETLEKRNTLPLFRKSHQDFAVFQPVLPPMMYQYPYSFPDVSILFPVVASKQELKKLAQSESIMIRR
jgi:hypothetical protein